MSFDANYSSVSLTLHAAGSNGSTTFTDSGPLVLKTTTVAGNAKISNANGKFGGTSMLFDGAGDWINYGGQAAFAFGSGDFTIEFWVKLNAVGAVQFPISFIVQGSSTANSLGISISGGGVVSMVSAGITRITGGTAFTAGQWYNIALCRQGTSTRLFIDGVQEGITYTDSMVYIVGANRPMIGADGYNQTSPFNGFIDELRITKGVARYTADFTPRTTQFEDRSTEAGDAVTVSPMGVLETSSGANGAMTSPKQIFYSGLIGGGDFAASVAISQSAYGGANSSITSPSATLVFNGHDSTGELAANLTMPKGVLSTLAGANSKLTSPKAALTIAATVINIGRADIEQPSATLSTSTTVTNLGSANLTFGYVNGGTYGLVGYSGAVLSVTLPDGTLNATGSAGSIGSAAITLPLFELMATGTGRSLNFADLTMPTAKLGTTARAALVMPFGVLTAIGHAVVSVSYEAYALNLNHIGENPVDEMTRYTNYPFDRIVRYQNSYFGMNSTGLYLLEGTTDDATPIDWTVQTAFTDFDSPQLKTVEMAYFGGRLGPAATVSLLVSENNTKTYTYTTPRDTDAQNYRQTFGRGNKARYYAMGATGSGDMSIDSITFNVANMARKV